ncbi:hypothetical protein Tco_0518022 [Tanacetum coccineum]
MPKSAHQIMLAKFQQWWDLTPIKVPEPRKGRNKSCITDSSSDSRLFISVSLGWLAKLLRNRLILSKRESTKAEIIYSSWSSWIALARSAASRKGRILGGGFTFSIAKNGIVNENYEQTHKEKIDYEKANVLELNSHLIGIKRVELS